MFLSKLILPMSCLRNITVIGAAKVDKMHIISRRKFSQEFSADSSSSIKSGIPIELGQDVPLYENDDAWDSIVDLSKLTEAEKLIYTLHSKALKNGKNMYIDPETGYNVMTRQFHLKRGKCCGNACRHCPFDQCNVPVEARTKTFNTAFYT
ncbi:unnamed protein product [Owenia fusiformis]|uniref:Uncharacterized protein n=1 Tax=Owenia fusiformis TaxID=6347 RepID=A0A8J1Y2W4_OWEFU|nr:unnamed protein product [Owenia fusiformis]